MPLDYSDAVDHEDRPASDVPCPRCGAALSIANHNNPKPDKYSCPDCMFKSEPDTSPFQGLLNKLFAWVMGLVWPYERLLGWLVGAGSIAAAVYGESLTWVIVPGIILWGFLANYAPSVYCQHCGHEHHPFAGFCENCGLELDKPEHAADPEAKPVYAGWLERRIPWDSVDLGYHVTVKYRGGDELLDRLATPRRLWKRALDVGTVLSLLATTAWLMWLTDLALYYWNRPGLLHSSSSGGSSGSSYGSLDAMVQAFLDFVTLDVVLTFAAISVGLVVSVVIHELGHAIAMHVHEYRSQELAIGLLFGVLPNYGYMKPDDNDLGPVASMRVYAGGILVNTATLLVVYGAVLGHEWAHGRLGDPLSITYFFDALGRAVTDAFYLTPMVYGFAIGSLVGIGNAVPFGKGVDGSRVLIHGVRGLLERAGYSSERGIRYGEHAASVALIVTVAALFIALV